MKIGLVDVDSHNFPNLCLMKLSAYHKAKGDMVEWWKPAGWYDLAYKSRVFTDTYSQDNIYIANAGEVIRGGAFQSSVLRQQDQRIASQRPGGLFPLRCPGCR